MCGILEYLYDKRQVSECPRCSSADIEIKKSGLTYYIYCDWCGDLREYEKECIRDIETDIQEQYVNGGSSRPWILALSGGKNSTMLL